MAYRLLGLLARARDAGRGLDGTRSCRRGMDRPRKTLPVSSPRRRTYHAAMGRREGGMVRRNSVPSRQKTEEKRYNHPPQAQVRFSETPQPPQPPPHKLPSDDSCSAHVGDERPLPLARIYSLVHFDLQTPPRADPGTLCTTVVVVCGVLDWPRLPLRTPPGREGRRITRRPARVVSRHRVNTLPRPRPGVPVS